jgi:hypothetical protein
MGELSERDARVANRACKYFDIKRFNLVIDHSMSAKANTENLRRANGKVEIISKDHMFELPQKIMYILIPTYCKTRPKLQDPKLVLKTINM